MRLLFTLMFLLFGFASGAEAYCMKNGEEVPPVAVADATGTITTKTPTGEEVRVSGFRPGATLCKSWLFVSASKVCGKRSLQLDMKDGIRHPKFCRGLMLGQKCFHIICAPPSPS